MKHLINPVVQQGQLSIIREISNKTFTYPEAINLTVGQPDLLTPEHIKEAGKAAIDHNQTQYTNNKGFVELCMSAAEFMRKKYHLHYNGETEVIVTHGATEAIDTVFRTILEPGSEVILPAPVYPGYIMPIRLCSAIPVYVDTSVNEFKLNAAMIKEKLTPKTRCVVIPYPSNPTGTLLSREELQEIAELLKDKDIFIVSDEVYSELTYDQPHVSIAVFEEVKKKTIVINGLSKSHAMTGWRIGFIFFTEDLITEFLKVHQNSAICACSISQSAAISALMEGINDADEMKKEYLRRRDYVYNRLHTMDFDVVKPKGAFYIFPSIKNLGMRSYEFALDLLDKAKVGVVPGVAFSDYGEGYVRISYATNLDTLKEAMDRIESYLKARK